MVAWTSPPTSTKLVARVRRAAGAELVGAYAGGSYALGAYAPGRSDLDVAVVVRDAASRALKEELVAALRHEALPCPARGLELVVYREAVVRSPALDALFELNLNTGAAMPFRVDYEADVADAHWFAIDRSILSQAGVALAGPPAAERLRPHPAPHAGAGAARGAALARGRRGAGDDAVLNACRSLRFVEEGVWSSKPEAGAWALGRVDDRRPRACGARRASWPIVQRRHREMSAPDPAARPCGGARLRARRGRPGWGGARERVALNAVGH